MVSLVLMLSCYIRQGLETAALSVRAEMTLVQPVKITLLLDNAGRPEWSPCGRFIAYHSRGPDGYYDVYVMNSDGTGQRCLTCESPELPGKNAGQPSWHPGGEWIVFQAEKQKHILPWFSGLAAPGIGLHNDIYIISMKDGAIFQLTDPATTRNIFDPTPTSGILQPHFSHDGKLLSWTERVGQGGRWGNRVIRVADFAMVNDTPRIANIRTFQPDTNAAAVYMESNDFMPWDSTLLICGNLDGQDEAGLDIYTLDLASWGLVRLTRTLDEFDECPHPSPDGKVIAYPSTKGFPADESGRPWWSWARGEFWLMDADGGNQRQLTHFNGSGYPESVGSRVIPAYVSWSPDGRRLALGVAVEVKDGWRKVLHDRLYLVEFE